MRRRAQELGVSLVCQGVKNKLQIYKQIKRKRRLRTNKSHMLATILLICRFCGRRGWRFGRGRLARTQARMPICDCGARAAREQCEKWRSLLLKAQSKWSRHSFRVKRKLSSAGNFTSISKQFSCRFLYRNSQEWYFCSYIADLIMRKTRRAILTCSFFFPWVGWHTKSPKSCRRMQKDVKSPIDRLWIIYRNQRYR